MSRRGGVRMSRRFLCFSVVFLLFAAAWPALADAPGVYAISGGTVHPVSGPPIANGVVIIRDGLIESVGASVPIPLDATVIDVKGSHVYPGLIDAQTSTGFPSPRTGSARRGAGRRRAQPEETLPDTSPGFFAFRNVKLSDDDVDAWRAV